MTYDEIKHGLLASSARMALYLDLERRRDKLRADIKRIEQNMDAMMHDVIVDFRNEAAIARKSQAKVAPAKPSIAKSK